MLEERHVPSYDGDAGTYLHKVSGLRVVVLKNKDREQFFSYVVYTTPEDSTGVFHIIEHTVLSGSRKYPVKEAFNEAMKRGCPTFMNAMTGADRTYYLASSAVPKDFDNIFDIYTDAVFSPLLRKETFLQEGIRISMDPQPHFEGVVFSEMQGAMSQHEQIVSSLSSRSLFPDTPYQWESGGDPRKICTLTYSDYLETYDRYYTPSNMTLFLYGDVDINGKLAFLDREYLSKRPYVPPVPVPCMPGRWTAPRRVDGLSPATDNDSDTGTVMLSWRLGKSTDRRECIILSILVDLLLGNPGCPLYKAILGSDLGQDLSGESGMLPDYADNVFAVGMTGARASDAGRISDFLLSELKRIAAEGFSKKEVEAALRRYEFSLREIPGGLPQGMRVLFRLDKSMVYRTDMLSCLYPEEDMEALRKEVEADPCFFEKCIRAWFVDNPHRLLSTVMPDASYTEEIDRAVAKELDCRLETLDPGDVELFENFSAKEDDEKAFASFPSLRGEDIQDEPFQNNPGSISDNIVRIPVFTGGVVYFDVVVDVSDFSYDELDDLNVLSRLMTMCSVGDMDMSAFQTEMRFSTGGFAYYLESGASLDGRENVFLMLRLKMLENTVDEAAGLLSDLLHRGRLDEKEIEAAVTDIITDYKSGLMQNGHTFAISSAQAGSSPSLYIAERLGGVGFWFVLEDLSKDIPGLASRLEHTRDRLLDRDRMLVQIGCGKECMEGCVAAAKAFLSSFEHRHGCGKVHHEVPSLAKRRAYLLPSPVSYIAMSAYTGRTCLEATAARRLFLSIISPSSIWNSIRAKGGAYGAGALLDPVERTLIFYSYRDPRLDATLDDFISCVDEEEIDARKLENALIQIRSQDLKPLCPAQKVLVYLRRRLFGITDEYRKENRKALLAVGLDDLEEARKDISRMIREDSTCTVIASRDAVSSSALDFEVGELPF